MVVIIIIGIIAAMAVPSMVQARLDRNAYDDAGAIMQLFRNARTRAVGRGGAITIQMTQSTNDRGTFQSYEAVTQNAGGILAFQTPVGTCKAPQIWSPLPPASNPAANLNVQLLDGVNLNGTIEADANIMATIWSYSGTTATQVNTGWVCFTPLGHVYMTSASSAIPVFDGQLPMVGPLEFRVQRFQGSSSVAFGTTRSVLLPPSGMARIFSHT
jgi:Tfp pilus assembly protein FimT